MRKTTALTLALLMAGSVFAGSISDKAKARFKSMNNPVRSRVAVMTSNPNTTKAFQMKEAGLPASPAYALKNATARLAATGATASLTTPGFGMIYGPDGETWFFTQKNAVQNYMYLSSEIVIYDNHHNKVGNISVNVPEGANVNLIEPYGQVTKKMFDNNDKTQELAVYVHYITRPGYTTDSTFIYSLDGNIVRKYEGQIADVVSIKQNAWTTVQRAILQRNDDYNKMYPDTILFDIIKPMGWGDTEPTIEHTFAVDYERSMYSDGPLFSIYQADGEPYYVLSYYKDTYVTGYDPKTYDPIIRENNPYIIDVYNKNYERVDSFGVYSEKPEDALYRMYAISMFSDKDLSKGMFTDDGKMSYIITTYDYLTASDDYRYSFDVYDGNGNKLKNICDNVVKTYFQLADIKGHEQQWGFLQTIGTTEQIQTVDLPSCTKATTIPAIIDGKNITATMDRYADGDTYKYVIKLTYATSDENGNVLAPVMWFNKDLTIDRYVTFNLGPNGENFSPLFTYESLDPYLFDTDNEHEYIYLAKQRRENSTVIDNVMVIANEDGSIIREFRGDDINAIYTGGILNYGSANPEMYCATKTSSGEVSYNINFFSLPFKKFAEGGDGTEQDPYLVSTLGDLMLMKTYPEACFKLTADIDMGSHSNTWSPIASFSGQLDGNGHTLKNLIIDTNNTNAGLFGSLESGSKVRNLVITNPTVKVNSGNSFVGVLAGTAMTDSIDNVHICNAEISGTTTATVGGFIGQTSNFSEIKGSSFDGVIDVPAATNVGGITGDIRTSSSIMACTVNGKLTADNTLGGIAGITVTGASMDDCHANVTLKANNTVGGIIGSNQARATVSRCIVEGTIEAQKAKWAGLSAGGIVGYMAADWTRSTDIIVSKCASTANIIIPDGTTDETVHRIVGWTIANESYEPGETVEKEIGLSQNYGSGTIGGKEVNEDDNTKPDGMDKNKEDLNTTFFTGLGYQFGSNVEKPWKGTNGVPVLWFENTALALTFNPASLTITEGNTADITVTIYGTDASEISLSSSDTEVAALEITDETENSVTVRIECKKAGTAVITATAGNVSATCTVNAVASGIAAAKTDADKLSIRFDGSQITAEGASEIALYNAGGQLVRRSNGATIATSGLGKGIFIVKATTANGNTVTEKAIVR